MGAAVEHGAGDDGGSGGDSDSDTAVEGLQVVVGLVALGLQVEVTMQLWTRKVRVWWGLQGGTVMTAVMAMAMVELALEMATAMVVLVATVEMALEKVVAVAMVMATAVVVLMVAFVMVLEVLVALEVAVMAIATTRAMLVVAAGVLRVVTVTMAMAEGVQVAWGTAGADIQRDGTGGASSIGGPGCGSAPGCCTP